MQGVDDGERQRAEGHDREHDEELREAEEGHPPGRVAQRLAGLHDLFVLAVGGVAEGHQVEVLGQRAHARVGVQVHDRHRGAPLVAPHRRGDVGGDERVPAEVVEEVGLDGELLGLQRERGGPHAEHPAFHLGARRHDLAGAADEPGRRRVGQLLAVDLAAGQHRQFVDPLQVGRHHVRRQHVAQVVVQAQQPLVAARGAGVRHEVAGDLVAGLARLQVLDGRGVHALGAHEHALDLAEVDAVTADLHLGVGAAQVDDLAALVDAREVTGAVDALVAVLRVRDEPVGGEVGSVEVAGGHPDSPDAQLAVAALRHRATLVVEDPRGVRGHRDADGHRATRLQDADRAGDGGLRRAVRVEHATPRSPSLDEFGGARLAADHEATDRVDRALDGRQHGRHDVEQRDRALLEERRQARADPAPVGRSGDQRGTDAPRRPHLLDREVERDRHALVDAVGGAHVVELGDDVQEVADAGLPDVDALGAARGARGVDDVGGRIALQVEARPRRRLVGELVLDAVEVQPLDVETLEHVGELAGRQEQREVGILREVLDAVGRRRRVDRHPRGARLLDGQQRDVQVARTRHEQTDTAARHLVPRADEVGHAVGGLVELAVGGAAALPLQRGLVGQPVAGRLEVVVHASLERRAHTRATEFGVGIVGVALLP